MNHRELQELEGRREISAEIAERKRVVAVTERYTTLPTSELQKDIDVLRIEEKLAGNLDAIHEPLLGSIRAARLLERPEQAEALRTAFELITWVQRELAEERGRE